MYHKKTGRVRSIKRKISKKDPKVMSASRINHELDILDEISSGLMDMMIEVGRGLERFSETRKKDDELSNKINEMNDRYRELRIEMECRYGKDCPYRLPIKRGAFGPIKRIRFI